MAASLIFSPSILASKHYNYEQLITALIKAGITHLHFDLMDGSLTPGMGLNPAMISVVPTSVTIDIHIMSDRPLQLLAAIPVRANTYVHTHLSMCPDYQSFIDAATARHLIPGITVGLHDDLKLLKPYLSQLQWINCMAVAKIGMTNQVFDPLVLNNVQTIKTICPPKCVVAIDGSVRLEHLKSLLCLVDVVVVGSLIYNASDYQTQIQSLFNLLNS